MKNQAERFLWRFWTTRILGK